MEFKKLEIEQESNWFKRILKSPHTKRTIIFSLIGAIGGLIYFLVTEGRQLESIETGNIASNMLVGAFLGFFITNSPCARNKC